MRAQTSVPGSKVSTLFRPKVVDPLIAFKLFALSDSYLITGDTMLEFYDDTTDLFSSDPLLKKSNVCRIASY